jgi:REP element-mobilizing transposase RayT
MPGIAFHITARTQGREKWFTDDIKPEIERIITTGVTSSKVLFLAHCVMDNHFHIVLRQGAQPLGWIMQPIMRRISLLVQRVVGVGGHVFERRFRSHPCENADYLRRAIVYTNLNATRARLCEHPSEYAWTSHTDLLVDEDCSVRGIQIKHTLNLFAHAETADRADLRGAYLRYVDWRMTKDDHDAAAIPYLAPEPPTDAGDAFFATSFCALPALTRHPQCDLRDKAAELLLKIDGTCSLDTLRYGRLNRQKIEVRRELIAALLQLDYRQCRVADFLRVSTSMVSLVAMRMRYG